MVPVILNAVKDLIQLICINDRFKMELRNESIFVAVPLGKGFHSRLFAVAMAAYQCSNFMNGDSIMNPLSQIQDLFLFVCSPYGFTKI